MTEKSVGSSVLREPQKRPFAYIKHARFSDGSPRFALDMYREDRSFLRLPARRESWTVCARDMAEAVRTVEYHFGLSALWYALTIEKAAVAPLSENPPI